jgi:hypothetical protein
MKEDIFADCGPQRGKGFSAFHPRRLSSLFGRRVDLSRRLGCG